MNPPGNETDIAEGNVVHHEMESEGRLAFGLYSKNIESHITAACHVFARVTVAKRMIKSYRPWGRYICNG